MISSQSASAPRCSDTMFGYGIGNCAGCNRFPVVIYKAKRADTWRCESCYRNDYGAPPENLVTA